jgi:hypothetical protein
VRHVQVNLSWQLYASGQLSVDIETLQKLTLACVNHRLYERITWHPAIHQAPPERLTRCKSPRQ